MARELSLVARKLDELSFEPSATRTSARATKLECLDSDPRNPKVEGPRATPTIVMDGMGWWAHPGFDP
jgi:hypothetical protein